jgi:hypothetical protein
MMAIWEFVGPLRTKSTRESCVGSTTFGLVVAKITDAPTLMGLGRRQVFRLAKAYGEHGPQASVSDPDRAKRSSVNRHSAHRNHRYRPSASQ